MKHTSREIIVISGIIKIVGAASAANNTITLDKGGVGVASVARSAAGQITMTLVDKWVECHGALATFQGAGAFSAKVESHDVSSAKTVVFTVQDDALADVDTANGVTEYIHFALHLKNSSVR